MARVGAALRAGPPYPMAEWETAGATTAALHLALARAFPSGAGARDDLDRWRDEAVAALEDIGRADPEVAAIIPAARERLAVLDRLAPPPVTRIHGDLHVAQMLRAGGAVLVIDFEGDPIRPLVDRRRPATPLYDLACLLRSLDHVGSAASKTDADPAPDAWIAEACAATAAAYEAGTGTPLDRDLLAALELVKECTEFVYAARFLPGWTYAPRNGMRRLLQRPVAIG
jgi:maltokinase